MKLFENYESMVNFNCSVLLVFSLIDNVLIYLADKYTPSLNNDYFRLHKRYGMRKVICIKLTVILIILLEYYVLDGPYGPNAGLITGYSIIVLILLVDLLRFKESDQGVNDLEKSSLE